ncbi:hypothetical protein TNCV_4160221 [Trichonephila clavipes]|nr:hypothetical protein TNCV_4160221 [Trichonephila clavipes]
MDVCKCIVSLRHGGTLNSRQATSPLVWLVEEVERWEAPAHSQVSSLKIGVGTSQIVLSHFPHNVHSVVFSQRSFSPRLIEDETFTEGDINNLIDFEDGLEELDSLRVDKNMQGSEHLSSKETKSRSELIAIDEALRIIKTMTSPDEIWILCDSQCYPTPSTGQMLETKHRSQFLKILKTFPATIYFQWIPSHIGLFCNDTADL